MYLVFFNTEDAFFHGDIFAEVIEYPKKSNPKKQNYNRL